MTHTIESPTDTVHQPTDEDLVTRAQQGDTQAFGVLYQRHHHRIVRYVHSRCRSGTDNGTVEDIAMDTWFKAFRGLDGFRGGIFLAWLTLIARNLVLDHHKCGRVSRTSLYAYDDALDLVAAPWIINTGRFARAVDEEVTNNDTLRIMWAHTKHLSAAQRRALTLRFHYDLSVTETAKIMGRSAGAVKALTHKACRRLAKIIPEDVLCA